MRRSARHQGVAKVALLYLFFFLVVAAFWTLKPLRTSSVVKGVGLEYYPLVKQGVVLISPLMVMALGVAARLFRRERIVQLFTTVFLVSSWVFWLAFVRGASSATRLAFYFFVDSYVTFMVALFWAYLNDAYSPEEARRHYSVIGLGGLCGGIAGSSVSGWASQALGSNIILIFTVFLAPIYLIVALLGRLTRASSAGALQASDALVPRGEALAGAREVMRSRYLLAVLAIVGCYEIVSTMIDFQFNATLTAAFAQRDAMAAYQGKVFFVGQVAALVVQLGLTTYVHRRFGAVHGLLVLPGILLLGSAGFFVVPGLVAVTVLIGGEAAFSYSINQTSKEMLYLPLEPARRYRAKAFIDVFGLRAAKAVGALLVVAATLWLGVHEGSSRLLIGLSIVALAGWFVAIAVVGRRLRRMTGAGEAVVAMGAVAAGASAREAPAPAPVR